jgi:hypothetical protein
LSSSDYRAVWRKRRKKKKHSALSFRDRLSAEWLAFYRIQAVLTAQTIITPSEAMNAIRNHGGQSSFHSRFQAITKHP